MHSSGLPQSAARRDVPGYALRARRGAAHCRGGLRGRSPARQAYSGNPEVTL